MGCTKKGLYAVVEPHSEMLQRCLPRRVWLLQARKSSTSDELFLLPLPSQLCILQQFPSQIRTLKPRSYPSNCQHNPASSYTGTSSIKLLKNCCPGPPEQAVKLPGNSKLSGVPGDKPQAWGASRKLNNCHGRTHNKGDSPIALAQDEKPLCMSRTQPWKGLVRNLQDCPSHEQHRENQGQQEKSILQKSPQGTCC